MKNLYNQFIFITTKISKLLSLMIFFIVSFNLNGQTILGPGDIVIIGYNTSGSPDNIAILALKPLTENTVFYVNDNELASATATSFTDLNEMEASFKVKAGQTIPAGTVIVLPWGSAEVSTSTYDWSSTSGAGLGNNNEEIFIYNASAITAMTPSSFIYYAKVGTSVNPSPSTLAIGTTSIDPVGSFLRYRRTGATYSGCQTDLLKSIGNTISNWDTTGATIITPSDWTFSITSTCNDTVPTRKVALSVSGSTGTEASASAITVTATASSAVVGDQKVNLGVSGTNITAGDYTLSSNMITILNGQTSGTATFTIVNDTLVEGNETATLTISNPSSGLQLDTTRTRNVTISDNDFTTVNLSVSANTSEEAKSTKIDVTATASVAPTNSQTVTLAITGTNVTASDYYLLSPTITLPAGQKTVTVSLTIADDGASESDETAVLTLSSPSSGVTLGTVISQNVVIKNNTNSFIRKVGTVTSTNGAEISAYDTLSKTLYVVAGPLVESYKMNNSGVLTLSGTVAPGFTPPAKSMAIPNSVAVNKGILAIGYAVVKDTILAQDTGRVSLYNSSTAAHIKTVKVGFLPDMITFTPDGSKLLTANEGEPNSYGQATSFDPEGSVSIIDMSKGAAEATVQQASFTSYNGQEATLRSQGVRIYGPGASAAKDFEPEYITFSNDGKLAYVTLQENNALAVLDIAEAKFTSLLPLGLKNHNTAGNGLDASDQDVAPNRINIKNWPIFGMYQPDAILSYTIGGQTYLVTANEGDSRAYTGYSEEVRVGASTYVLDTIVFPNASTLKQNANLGRLTLSNATGDTDGDGDIDRIESLGARSFSIWNTSGKLVYDSGDQFETITASKAPSIFNSDGTNASFDGRSDNKGPEPEGVALGVIDGKTYAFIGLERTGDIMIYDVTNPNAPTFIQYMNTLEDTGVEGLIFIKANESPTGKPLLVATAEVSRTITVYEVGSLLPSNTKEAIAELDEINVFPNPAFDAINVSSAKFPIKEVSIYDTNGRFVKSVNNNFENISLVNLNSGIYITRIQTSNGTSNKMVVKN
jgi:uncharacterized protein